MRRRTDPQDRRKVAVEARPDRMAPLSALFEPLDSAFAALRAEQDGAFPARMADVLEPAEAVPPARVGELNREAPNP